MQFISFFLTIAVINAAVWWFYRRQMKRQQREQQARLNNAFAYADELYHRAEHYRTAMLIEVLAAKTKTQPAVKVYPIRNGEYWVIATYLN